MWKAAKGNISHFETQPEHDPECDLYWGMYQLTFKNFFPKSVLLSFHLVQLIRFISESEDEISALNASFTAHAAQSMPSGKAPGFDWYPLEFYKKSSSLSRRQTFLLDVSTFTPLEFRELHQPFDYWSVEGLIFVLAFIMKADLYALSKCRYVCDNVVQILNVDVSRTWLSLGAKKAFGSISRDFLFSWIRVPLLVDLLNYFKLVASVTTTNQPLENFRLAQGVALSSVSCFHYTDWVSI